MKNIKYGKDLKIGDLVWVIHRKYNSSKIELVGLRVTKLQLTFVGLLMEAVHWKKSIQRKCVNTAITYHGFNIDKDTSVKMRGENDNDFVYFNEYDARMAYQDKKRKKYEELKKIYEK